MKKFKVTIYEAEIRAYDWLVKAKNEEEAKENALNGESGELIGQSEFISEIDSIDREVMEVERWS